MGFVYTLTSVAPYAAGALLDNETTDKGQDWTSALSTPVGLIFGDDAAKSVVDSGRTAELTGDGKDMLLGAYSDWQEGKSVGDILKDRGIEGAGVAADYVGTNVAQSALDYLDDKLGGMIPDSLKAMLADKVGEAVQDYVNSFREQDKAIETTGQEVPDHLKGALDEAKGSVRLEGRADSDHELTAPTATRGETPQKQASPTL